LTLIGDNPMMGRMTDVDWTDVTAIREALAAKLPAKDMVRTLRHEQVSVQKAITSLTDAELGALAAAGSTMTYKLLAVANRCFDRKQFEAALRIHDHLVEVPLKELPSSAGAQALLHVQDDEHKMGVMRDRARRYLDHYLPFGPENTGIFLNASFVCVELGELDRAVEQLRSALLGGEAGMDGWLANPAFKPLHGLSSFSKLETLKPLYPPALRALKLSLCVRHEDAIVEQARAIDLEWLEGTFTQAIEGYPAIDARPFCVFGSTGDGGDIAFWRRPGARDDLATQPIVIFGSDGMLSVYADCLASFFCLFSSTVSLLRMESEGFREAAPWVAPAKTKRAPKAKKAMLDWLAKAKIDVGRRDAASAIDAAMALVPELQAAVFPARR
jgi:hypothetical protein